MLLLVIAYVVGLYGLGIWVRLSVTQKKFRDEGAAVVAGFVLLAAPYVPLLYVNISKVSMNPTVFFVTFVPLFTAGVFAPDRIGEILGQLKKDSQDQASRKTGA